MLLFKVLGDPAATIHTYTWPCAHLQVPCPNPLDKYHPFQVRDQSSMRKQPFVLSWLCSFLAPQPPGPGSAWVQLGRPGDARPPPHLPNDSDYNSGHIFPDIQMNLFWAPQKTHSLQLKFGLSWIKFVEYKNTLRAEQSQMPQVPTLILKTHKTEGVIHKTKINKQTQKQNTLS